MSSLEKKTTEQENAKPNQTKRRTNQKENAKWSSSLSCIPPCPPSPSSTTQKNAP
jgi:hypothetical protein